MTEQRSHSEAGIALAGLVFTFIVTAVWWALALWPVENAPYWLERTRYVCFGVNESGLPDAGGWIGLIAGPLGTLAILFVGWRRGVNELLERARHSMPLATVLSFLAVGTVAIVVGTGFRVRQSHAGELLVEAASLPPSTYPRLNETAPQLVLIRHDGKQLSLSELNGRTVLLTFAFAHCTTICPVIVRDVLTAQQQLRADGDAPVVLVVTLDPWRDTPSRLASMARDWAFPENDAWMLGGSVEQVEKTLFAWRVPYERDQQTGDVIHPALAYIIDKSGRIAFAAAGGSETIVALARRLEQPVR
jgi:cytochrome oxidase Cu insertion factor (SCO1/SenC/PrrC family)